MKISRRELIQGMSLASIALAGGMNAVAQDAAQPQTKLKGRIKHCISPGVLRKMSLEEKAKICQEIGILGMDFVGQNEWPILKQYGLVCTMTGSHSLSKGLANKDYHEECLNSIRKSIEITAEAGFPNVICFSGNRGGIPDDVGMENCAIALKQIVGFAEEKKITLCMELLNSKVNHKDYMCDHTAWGVELCKKVGSPNMKLLYDIYHMQIMEGDIIRTIKDNIDYFGHIHTAGNPGRNEIDDTQELYYPAIMRAIADSGYKGYVGQEYGPKNDPLTSLKQAIEICDV